MIFDLWNRPILLNVVSRLLLVVSLYIGTMGGSDIGFAMDYRKIGKGMHPITKSLLLLWFFSPLMTLLFMPLRDYIYKLDVIIFIISSFVISVFIFFITVIFVLYKFGKQPNTI